MAEHLEWILGGSVGGIRHPKFDVKHEIFFFFLDFILLLFFIYNFFCGFGAMMIILQTFE